MRHLFSKLPPAEPPGDCVPLERLRALTPADEQHVSWCDDCADKLAALALADDDVMLEPSVEVLRRVKTLGPSTGSSARLPVVRVPRRAARPEPKRIVWFPYALAAAAALLVVLLWGKSEPPKPRKPEAAPVATPPTILPEKIKQPDVAKAPEPKKPDPVIEPKKPEPKQPDVVKTPEPKKPDPEKPPIVEKPGPSTVVEPKKPEPEPVRLAMLTEVRGVAAPAEAKSTDVIETDRRQRAGFTIDGTAKVTMRESTRVRIESKKDALIVTLEAGELVSSVEKSDRAFWVSTDDATAVVKGTVFSVINDGRSTLLVVREGEVEFGNKVGAVLVKAGYASKAEKGKKPATPKALALDLAWTQTPELGAEPAGPWIDFVKAGPKAQPGVVVSTPYADHEVQAGRIGRRAAEVLDGGLVIGYAYRNRDKRIWFNIDRTTQGLFNDKGELSPATETAEAKKVFEKWAAAMRSALGGAKEAQLIVTVRDHSETRDAIEVATNVIDRRRLEEARALYEKRLRELAVSVKLPMRIDALDSPEYEYDGAKVKFKFTESDAKTLGYMQPQFSKRAITLFFPSRGGLTRDDERLYGEILAEVAAYIATHK